VPQSCDQADEGRFCPLDEFLQFFKIPCHFLDRDSDCLDGLAFPIYVSPLVKKGLIMFKWLLPAVSRRRHSRQGIRRAVPRLEALETRDCPTLLITSFAATPTTGCLVQFSGTVVDNQSQTVTVNVMGVVNTAIPVASDGTFTATVQAGSLGGVMANAVDNTQQVSLPVKAVITGDPPQILNLRYSRGTDQCVTFTGTVLDETPGGVTVNFGGLPALQGQQTVTQSDGSFSLTLTVPTNGQVWAQAVDCWGLESDLAYCTLS
jgi:hypothetical protein